MKNIITSLFICCFLTSYGHSSSDLVLNYTALDTIKEIVEEEAIEEQKQKKGMLSFGKKRKADKEYEDFAYMSSADLYNKLAKEGALDAPTMEKLASSYRLNGESEDAEFWYAQLINDTDNPDNYLHYAQALQSNGKCEDAIRWYKEYETKTNDKSRSYLEDCAELAVIKENSTTTITNLNNLNGQQLDYSAVPYADGVVFTSTRGTTGSVQILDEWTQESFADLYYAEKKEDGSYEKPQPLRGKINKKFHDGVATFDQSQQIMIFSRNNRKGKNKEGVRDLKLYAAKNPQKFWADSREDPLAMDVQEVMEGEESFWVELGELDINSEDYSSCHPSLALDGKRLYFASNREGGYGGMDIWMSQVIDGVWQEPTNLGATVNSSGNEIFPFIAPDEKLYYSSDGFMGVGGLDIFVAEKNIKSDENSWMSRENLGKPFNSEKDDFSFTVDKENKRGYLTSNRDGGLGADDIYEWEGDLNSQEDIYERQICVYNEETNERIADVLVTMIPMSGKSGQDDLTLALKPRKNVDNEYVLSVKGSGNTAGQETYTTNAKGIFERRVEPTESYEIHIDKKGYLLQRQEVTATEIMAQKEFCIPMTPRNCLTLNGIVQSEQYGKAISEAKVKLLDQCRGGYQETISDVNGMFEFCVECDCEYQLIVEKKYFSGDAVQISTTNEACATQENVETVVTMTAVDMNDWVEYDENGNPVGNGANGFQNGKGGRNPNGQNGANDISDKLSDYMNPDGSFSHPNFPDGFPPPNEWTPELLRQYFLGKENSTFQAGQSINLNNIYYDFDEYTINNEAYNDLDYLATLMNTYPSMEISLSAHTDSRGTDSYNQWLSRKRAKSAQAYLLDQGIASHRIHGASGMGENLLVNNCSDGVECSEAEHQQNRRTEFQIVRLDDPSSEVISK